MLEYVLKHLLDHLYTTKSKLNLKKEISNKWYMFNLLKLAIHLFIVYLKHKKYPLISDAYRNFPLTFKYKVRLAYCPFIS